MKPKLKVLYIITKSDVGGAQKYVADLAAHLDPTRFETTILYGGTDLRWLSNRVSPLLLWNDWLAVAELVSAFRRERPDVIHLNSSKAGVVGSIAAAIANLQLTTNNQRRIRVVFTAHGWVFNPSNHYSPLVRWCYILLHTFAARFQDVIINVSEHDRALALRYRIAPPAKLVVIHNGIDPNIPFLSKEEARWEIISRLTTYDLRPTTAHPWVGSIGRLTREKDYGTLIAAAREVPHAYFFIIGAGQELNRLLVACRLSLVAERFFIVPPSGDDAKLLKAFDVFTLSSIKEGLPYTLLEAAAAGVPAVVTDAGGMPEVAEPPRDAIVPQKNPPALAAAIVRVLKEETPARSARVERFSVHRMARETQGIYS